MFAWFVSTITAELSDHCRTAPSMIMTLPPRKKGGVQAIWDVLEKEGIVRPIEVLSCKR